MSRHVLVIAPHPDDETLGAGGTIAKFASRGDRVFVLVVSGHLPPLYTREQYETTVREAHAAFDVLGVAASRFFEIPATMVANEPHHALNDKIVRVVAEFQPQMVLCPYPDRHVDHRSIFESVMVATRPVGVGAEIDLLAAYETLSETHWNAAHIEPNFVPNLVVDISGFEQRKAEALACYKSQIQPSSGPRSIEAALALTRFRGTQAGFAYGEAFHVIRMRA
jgi:LmbE family N-acetylglucosaminyl deacetylase